MDLMLSLPISRREMLIGRVMSLFTGLLFILTICFLAFYASSVIWPEFDVPPADLALAIYGAFFPLAVIITFTLFLVSVIPSSKRFAGPIAYFFLLGSFLLHSFSQTVEGLKDLQPFFIFEYYSARNVILYGVEWSDWILLAAVAAIFLGLASWFIDRKELGV
jgi:ABC-type transport system involved in multi-copper enzyme maturation permease subunit